MLPSVNSIQPLPGNSGVLSNGLMDSKAIRRANLIGLLREFRTLQAIATQTDTVAAHLSQIKNGVRNMGDAVARKLERALHKPEGWMDMPQFGPPDQMVEQAELLHIFSALSEKDREAWLRHGRLMVERDGPQGPNNPFGNIAKGGRKKGTQ